MSPIQRVSLSLLFNLLYALYHGVLGIWGRSVWFLSLCAYYTVLAVLRFSAVLCGRKGRREQAMETETFVMGFSGGMLILLSVLLAVVNYISLSQNIAAKRDAVLMITIATYTFYKLTMALVRAVRQRKDPSPLLAAIRYIGCAEAAASILTLQRSMLVSFEGMAEPQARLMNAGTGAGVCLVVLLLGIDLIKKRGEKYV